MNIIDMTTCPRCGNETMFVDADTHTGEFDYFCQLCGHGFHMNLKKDENGNFETEDVTYNRSELVFGIKDIETEKIVWEKPISDIENLTADIIYDFINHKPIFGKNLPLGTANIFHKTNNYEELFYRGNVFIIPEDNNKLVVRAILKEESNTVGHGIILIHVENEDNLFHQVKAGETKEEVMQKAEEMKASVKDKNIKSTITWWNSKTNELEIIER